MTYLTPVTAKDEAYTLVSDAFAAYLATTDYDVDIRYQGNAKKERPTDYWVRFSMQQVQSPQRAFVHTEDGADKRVYETSGLIFAQVNAAISSEDSFRIGDLLATALRDILRDADTPSGMWFRNARFNEIPASNEFYKWNVVAEYEYDEQA